MSIITVYIDEEGHSAMACDTQVTVGVLKLQTQSKIFKVGDRWILGFAGEHMWPGYRSIDNLDGPNEFGSKWIQWGLENILTESNKHGNLFMNGEWLLLDYYKNEIHLIDRQGISHSLQGYAAIGSGAEVAMGAMSVLRSPPASYAAVAGVEAAIKHAEGCGGEVIVTSFDEDSERFYQEYEESMNNMVGEYFHNVEIGE